MTAINAVPSSAGILSLGKQVTFTLDIDTAVQVFGDPTLLLSNGATATFDAAASSGTSLVFDYTVVAGQNTADLLVNSLPWMVPLSAAPGSLRLRGGHHLSRGRLPQSVTTADLNGDGKLDLVVADAFGGVSVLLGTGTGGFGAATNLRRRAELR